MDVREFSSDELVALVPVPADDANKYTRGKLTALVGSARYPGAACLVARASQRMGAGYTEVVTAPEAMALVHAASPSLVVRSWEGLQPLDLPVSRPGKPCALAVGSGFDAQDEEVVRLVQFVLKRAQAPVLVDGGGLAALSTKKGRRLLKRRFILGFPTVITPHGGEAARLAEPLGLATDDPARLALSLARAYGVTAAVKGPDTFISDGDQVVRMALGTPALAKAGTGDVLAGLVAALLAQGLEPLDAAVLGTSLHALAGRAAEARLTSVCVTAEDVVDFLPEAFKTLVSEGLPTA